ncbi:exonuclease domain-containing protein [Luteimicrobium subarcticum]|uniref:DNA polymerase-3 subunit epsilon n=1 Tax=Luteimicrobium subarcticum TaxID=620910 RepID=A0A2M8WVB1_9MICO|nr:exonuclease domain-containing protein [Luteimicrobium subarcticum]PJI94862.1 DNA polymerase-3 subunit epsilon [Luteimicrobium subarcticum]
MSTPHAHVPGPSWTTSPLLGVDTETTGVDPRTDRVVSAALVHRDGVVTEVRTWLVDPGVEIPEAATAVHGITTAHARERGQDPVTALEQVAAQLHEASAEGVPVVAFNASYDLDILEAELARNGLRTLRERLGHDVGPVIDPFVLDRALDPERPGPRTLGATCAVYGVLDPDGERAASLHAADVDVIATLDLLAAMAARFPHLAALDVPALERLQDETRRAWAQRRAEAAAERAQAARTSGGTSASADPTV